MELFFETARECWSTIHNGGWPELGWWSYILLALLVATEGPVSTLLGAAAAATGILDIQYVFLSALLGNVLGDSLWYSVGYVNNLKQIHRFGSWFGIQSHHIDRLEHEMHTHATKLIALSKLAIGLIVPTLIAAGLARVPWRRWFPLVLSIEVGWTLLMVNLGFHGAGLITQLERGLQLVGVVFAVLLIGGIVWYGRRFFAQSEASMVTAHETTAHGSAVDVTSAKARASMVVTYVTHALIIDHPQAAAAGDEITVTRKALCRPFPAALTIYKRNTYKQLVKRLSAPHLSAQRLTHNSLAARSAMTRAIAGSSMTYSLSPSRQSRQIQANFAGD